MRKRAVVIAWGAILTFALQIFLGGCSGASQGSAQPATTKEQKLNLINKVPLTRAEKQRLTEKVEKGGL
jgi:hypothetical protein